MDKRSLIKEILDIEGIKDRLLGLKITYDVLLDTLSCTDKTYNLSKSLGISVGTTTRYMKVLFPDRPPSNAKVDIWLLHKYGYRECKKCSEVLELEDFFKNSGQSYGLNGYCKACQSILSSPTSTTRQSKYRASKLQRTPNWLVKRSRKV